MEKELDLNNQKIVKKYNSLYSFIQIGFKFFNDILKSTLLVKTESKEQLNIQQAAQQKNTVAREVDKFINSELIDEVNVLLKNGYRFQPYQLDNYNKLLSNKLNKDGLYFLNECIKKENYIPHEFLIIHILYNSHSINTLGNDNTEISKRISNYIGEKFHDKEFASTFYKNFLLSFNKMYEEDLKLLNEVTYGSSVFKTVDERVKGLRNNHSIILQNFSLYSSQLANHINNQQIIDLLSEIVPKTTKFQSIINILIQKVDREYQEFRNMQQQLNNDILRKYNTYFYYPTKNMTYVDSFLEQIKSILKNELKKESQAHLNKLSGIIDNPIDLIKNVNIKDFNKLPLEASTILSSLKDDIKYCLENEKFLSDDKQYRVSSLLENDISEIITKYITIHPDYRETLFNQNNRNASQIMVESLSQVSHILKEYIEEINQLKLDDLSANNRKIKML